MLQTGWGKLSIVSNPAFRDEVQMFAAGYFEGAVTQHRIFQHYTNLYSSFFGNISVPVPAPLADW